MHAHHLIALLSSAGAASAAPNVFKRDYFGPAVYTGPSQADIIYTSTVMVPGRNPGNKQSGFLTIWPGISNGTGDLIQSTVDSTQLTVEDCGATADQWCAMGSLFGNDANGNARQINGPMKAVSASDRIKIEYIRGAPKENGYEWDWTQMVTNEMTGEYISSLVSVSGSMRGWGTATECQADCEATIDTHYYYDTKIVLESGDMSYGRTVGALGDASFSDFTGNEDGSIWTIQTITIPPMQKNSPRGDHGIVGYVGTEEAPSPTGAPTSTTFTTDASTTDVFTSDAATTDVFPTDAATTDALTTDASTTSVFTDDAAATDVFTTDAFTTDALTTDAFTTDAFTTDAFTTDPSTMASSPTSSFFCASPTTETATQTETITETQIQTATVTKTVTKTVRAGRNRY